MKKTLSLLLVLAMLCTALLGVTSFAAEESTEAQLEIAQANLKFEETVYLLVAVNYASAYSTLEDAQANVTLKITNDATGEVYNLSADSSVVLSGHVCFTLTELGAKNMGDQLSIQAYNKGVASGKSATYSILEYSIKARGTTGASFDAILDAMIAYGAAAREVYNHAPEANSYDLTKEWGCVTVNGSNEGKVIAEVGSAVSFTPNTAKIGANPVLYDMALTPITEGLSVSEGASRYFYVGDAQRTIAALDITKATSNCNMVIDNPAAKGAGSAITKYLYTSLTSNGNATQPTTGKQGTNYIRWGLSAGNNTDGTSRIDVVTGDDGYIKFELKNKESGSFQTSSSSAYFKTLDVFTMSITIGKEGSSSMIPSAYRFRKSGSGEVIPFIEVTNSGNNSVLKMNGTTLATLYGEAGVNNFVTLHFVVNKSANSVTAYVEDNPNPVAVMVKDGSGGTLSLSDLLTNTGYPIDWTFYNTTGITLIQKFIFSNGNIFE